MRILVTGGAGYIGSHAVRLLIERDHEVWVLDNLSRGHRRAVPPGALIVGDLHDESFVTATLRRHRIEAVVHFAAYALVSESVEQPGLYRRNNFEASLSLLRAMQLTQVDKLVYSSTCAVYGATQSMPITEKQPTNPITPYGQTKLAVEQALAAYAEAGLGSISLRYFNAAGAHSSGQLGEDHTPETHLIPCLLQVALGQRADVTIHGTDYPTPDGTCIRDYVHVEDLAAAHLAALEHLQPAQTRVFNLGLGRGVSVREVVDVCRHITGHSIPVIESTRRAGDPPELVASAERARHELNWQPTYDHLHAIVETAWRWHRTHPRGYGS